VAGYLHPSWGCVKGLELLHTSLVLSDEDPLYTLVVLDKQLQTRCTLF